MALLSCDTQRCRQVSHPSCWHEPLAVLLWELAARRLFVLSNCCRNALLCLDEKEGAGWLHSSPSLTMQQCLQGSSWPQLLVSRSAGLGGCAAAMERWMVV